MNISAALFKTHCLGLMDQINRTHEEVVITKHGKPLARLMPFEPVLNADIFGRLRGSVLEQGDLISPIDEVWDADR